MKYATSPTPSISGRSSFSYVSRTQSPLPPPINFTCATATNKTYKFIRRLFKFDQMDFEFALWQIAYLFYNPQQVYRNFSYRKQTKLQYARDDPAFLVLLVISLCVTSLGFAWVLRLGLGQTIYFLFYVVFVDCILCGIITASILWFLVNKYMRVDSLAKDVEWGYAFDVHLNAFYPPLIIIHFIQLFFYNAIISQDWFFSRLFGNTLWLLAIGYYVYITFLGYNCINHLKNTRAILAVMPIALLVYIVTLIIGWNFCVTLMNFYHYRVL
ncbi:protein unc-50 homolog [Culicoides brevitarsis]|uniref:protein unc-50 homolog n=1 Tax=Culicoides brevitarsis TaxID=469753 RepID=UPI00307B4733